MTANKIAKVVSGVMLAVSLLIIAFVLWIANIELPEATPEQKAKWAAEAKVKQAAQAEEDKACRKDIDCFFASIKNDAIASCQVAVERLANYDVKWTSGFSGPSFASWSWADSDAGTVILVGNQVKFQNGFGAWQRHAYQCAYNPEKGALFAQAWPDGT